MKEFNYIRAKTTQDAYRSKAREPQGRFIAGGTNLVDLMKEGVDRPSTLIDINRLSLALIEERDTGLRLGSLARNSDTANHRIVRERYPLLSQAILAGASAQLRNAASNGGNLLQRTRCYFFYDTSTPCNKRVPNSGCSALEGFNRIHAIFGGSPHCIAVHPSDMCVALSALDAVVNVDGPSGPRRIPFSEFHRLPGSTPEVDTNLRTEELITSIDLPSASAVFAANSHYLKVRDRTSYAFALVSVAAALEIENGLIKQARISMGGVAHKPWRSIEAEKMLTGSRPEVTVFQRAADGTMKDATGYDHNRFKIELGRRAIVRSLTIAAAKDSL